MRNLDPIVLTFSLGLLALVPILIITTTAFLKIAIVLSLVKNALGVQQAPPNMAVYALALLLTVYVMAPVGMEMAEAVGVPSTTTTVQSMISDVRKAAEPLRKFMVNNSKVEQRDFFLGRAKQLWPAKISADVRHDDFLIVAPAFVVSELTSAFQIGFLLYLPFVVIDLVVSNILMAMGMMMVSPVT
ncbi:type III secretion system export apparatus subunit SctR, partial [Lacisediminimonas sp.]|uniref:type III secretion system export apparatus subunit SctR n=1 Tax=Lacisediminimonas sp. TaxID=3060582 RepID=UPI00271574D0